MTAGDDSGNWEKTSLGDYLHYVPPGHETAVCGAEPDRARSIPADGYCSTCMTICWTIRHGEHDRLAPADIDVVGWPATGERDRLRYLEFDVDVVDYERIES